MKKDKTKRKIILDSDLLLKIYAIIGAIVIWFIMSITLYSSVNKTIYNVPVTINPEESYAKNYGLEPIDFEGETVNVKVSGKRYEIGNLKPDDIKATVAVIGVTTSGEHTLGINISPNTGKNFDVVSTSKSTVTVTFDKMMTKEFVISAEAPFYTVPTDYIQESPVANPQTVEITGPQQQIERISRVVARTENKESITSSISVNVPTLFLYNSDNIKLDTTKLKFSTNNFYVDMRVNKVKEVPFNFEIQYAPPNFDSSGLKFDYSQSYIQIAGEESVIDSINEINLGYVDLRNVNLDSKFDFDVSLDSGISNLSAISKVSISIDASKLSQKTFSISKDQIHVIGAPSQYDVSVQSVGIENVVLEGPSDIISKVNPEDVIAQVDLSKEEIIPNNYTKAVTIYCPNYNSVWSYGTKDVTLTVSEKK